MRSVTSLQNDTIKFVRSLEMRKVRRETGQFVAEGASVLITARDNGHLPRTLIVRSGAQMAGEVAKLIQAVEAAGGDVIEATLEIMEKLATKDNPQSVIGVFDQLWQTPPLPASIEPEVTWLALEHVRDPGNLGTIIRTADAVGAAGVILIGTCCDPFSRECTRATMGSGRWRLNTVTATVHTLSISTHNSNEPSCEPQVAANRYCSGSCELELVATLSTEKSLFRNDHARQTKAIATKVS